MGIIGDLNEPMLNFTVGLIMMQQQAFLSIGKIADLQSQLTELHPHMDLNYSDLVLTLLQVLEQLYLAEQVI